MSNLFNPPEAPTPPNPIATAAAQTGTNVSTAIANSYLGNMNQRTPQGNLTNEVTGNYSFTDPTSGQTFNIPRWTTTQELSPMGQQTFAQTQQAQSNMAGIANQQSQSLGNLLGQQFDPSRGNFNALNYLQQNPDVAAAARNSPLNTTQSNFNTQAYLQANPDVRASGMDPWQHYQQFGQREGRQFTPIQTTNSADFAARHYQQFGMNEGRGTGGTPASPMGDINLFNRVGDPTSGFADAGPLQDSYASGGAVQYGFNPGWDITRSYGPQDNYGADRQRIEAGLMERINPQLKIEQDRMREQLANQGIAYGSAAYTNAMDNYNRQANDARLGVIGIGGQEQQRMDQMAAQRAAFQNAAQQQGYSQAGGLAQFYNQAQQQAEQQNAARAAFGNQAEQTRFDQLATRAQFFNAAQNQMLGRQSAIFNAQNQLRNQGLQESYQQRNQPINEITALLSGSQVQAPNFINAQRTTIPTTDVAGLINQNFAQQNDIYKTGTASWNDLVGGLIGGGSRALGGYLASDERIKENVVPMGSVFSEKGELPIYAYDYKNDDPDGARHVGPMAQDVERLDPSAVRSFGGVKHINVDKMGSIFGGA